MKKEEKMTTYRNKNNSIVSLLSLSVFIFISLNVYLGVGLLSQQIMCINQSEKENGKTFRSNTSYHLCITCICYRNILFQRTVEFSQLIYLKL